EAHFLAMLKTYLPPLKDRPPPFWKLISQALQVRRLAERAAVGIPAAPNDYAYSEQVRAWTEPLVKQADLRRRLGEDRLFASDDRAWNQAKEALSDAETIYQRALGQAKAIRSALATRDRVFASLPDYSRWVAHRQLDDLHDDLAGQV